tara:strand:+ start:3436 stop:3693 length:258 start_codon:yes stop_codon:yes gene_type:complete
MLRTQATRDRAVTIAEAAEIAGRSVSWVRSHRTFGPLLPLEVDGRQAVSLESLSRFLRELASAAQASNKATTHLRLVVDNTKSTK